MRTLILLSAVLLAACLLTPYAAMAQADVPALIAQLDNPNPALRRVAASTLGKAHVKDAVAPLTAMMLRDHQQFITDMNAAPWYQLSNGDAGGGLFTAMQNAMQRSAATAAATALGDIGDPAAVASLVTMMGLGHKVPILYTSQSGRGGSWTFASMGDSLWAMQLPDRNNPQPGVDLGFLDTTEPRKAAVTALGRLGGDDAVRALLGTLKQVNLGQEAADALGMLKDPKAFDPLVGLLSSNTDTEKRFAARALGGYQDNRAVPPIVGLLRDKNEYTRAEAAAALGCIGDNGVIDSLLPLLTDAKAGVRAQTASALGKLATVGDARVIDLLTPLVQDKEPAVCKAAKEALNKLTVAK